MKKRIAFYTIKIMGSNVVECEGIDPYIDELHTHNITYRKLMDKIKKDKFVRVNNEKQFDVEVVMSSYIKNIV